MTGWTRTGRQVLHHNSFRTINLDTVRTHTGDEIVYSWADTPAASFVVPLTDDGEIVMIHQYRYPIDSTIWEVPAGAIEAGETPVDTARRELAEEVGGSARDLTELATIFTAAAHLRLECHLFLATGVTIGTVRHEATELMAIHRWPARDALAAARNGEVGDTQSALALLVAEPLILSQIGRR